MQLSCSSASSRLNVVAPEQGLALRCLAHGGGLALACGVAGRARWTLGAAVLPAAELVYAATAVCEQVPPSARAAAKLRGAAAKHQRWLNGVQRAVATVTVQAMLDVLLLMGHRWDAEPAVEAVLNCWIVYIAGCGCLLAQTVISSAPGI